MTDGLLSDDKTREHLRNGFPARIHYRLELWRKGGVLVGDDRSGTLEWDVLVNYDPTAQLYNMVRRSSDDSYRENFGGFATLSSAELQLAKPYRTSLHPTRSGRYYYNLIGRSADARGERSRRDAAVARGPTAPEDQQSAHGDSERRRHAVLAGARRRAEQVRAAVRGLYGAVAAACVSRCESRTRRAVEIASNSLSQ